MVTRVHVGDSEMAQAIAHKLDEGGHEVAVVQERLDDGASYSVATTASEAEVREIVGPDATVTTD